MKNLIITTTFLTIWFALFSQHSEFSSPDQGNRIQKTEKNSAIIYSINPTTFEDTLTAWCQSMNVPGMSVCILKNGEVYWDLNYGFANIEEDKQVTDSTCFILCSVSKLFVQTAIMQQYEQGNFELHANINGNLPLATNNIHYPDSAVTYFQLMTHTSSIVYGFPNLYDFVVWGVDPTIILGDFLEGSLIPGVNPTYYQDGYLWGSISPGTQWNYSNIGNCLLGYLTECMSEQELEDYIQENIFTPLGIGNASYFLSNIDTSYLAVPYNNSGGSYTPSLQPNAPFYPSAFLKMSTLDLVKFLGMYMNNGTYNGNTLLEPETVELITTPIEGSIYNTPWGQQCLTWGYLEDQNLTYWGGGWSPIASSGIGYNKDDHWGIIFLVNTRLDYYSQHIPLQDLIVEFAQQYEAFSIENITISDTDMDQVIEPNETISLGLSIRNNCNYPDSLEDVSVKISTNNPFIDITDSIALISTFNYLEEIQLSPNQFTFTVSEELDPGNIEFQLQFTWSEENEYMITFELFAGEAEILLVRDETNRYIEGTWVNSQEWYLDVLDSIQNSYGYNTHYYDLEIRDNPTIEFLNNFPIVIWYTGYDLGNTLSANNQTILGNYLENGGNLFLSGQNISDELQGSNFLSTYLHATHVSDTWNASNTINGIENDPIGNGLSFNVNLNYQPSMSVIEPLGNAQKVFGYSPGLEGAAVRYENNNYKSIFFSFGFEAVIGFDTRYEIMDRILSEYFIISGNKENSYDNKVNSSIQVFPNPVKSTTTLSYHIKNESFVELKILDISGKLITVFVNKIQLEGQYQITLDGDELPPGVYFCVLKTNPPGGGQTIKLIKM